MTLPAKAHMPVGSAGEAEQVVANLERIMDTLLALVEEETALVRAGKLNQASLLEAEKTELAGHYLAATERLKASRPYLAQVLPDTLDALRRRHDEFRALLQINLTVLATAHAVSEGIVRGVASEINRTQVPTTYGASGKPAASAPKATPPIAISRSL